jgi:hypothetical protein
LHIKSASGLAGLFIILVIFAGSATPSLGIDYPIPGTSAAIATTKSGGGNRQSSSSTPPMLEYLTSANVVQGGNAVESPSQSFASSLLSTDALTLKGLGGAASNLISGGVVASIVGPLPLEIIPLVSALPPLIGPAQAAIPTVTAGGSSQGIAYDSGKGEVFVTNGLDPTVPSATVSIIADTISGTTTTTTTHTTPTTTTHPTSTVACTPLTTVPGATSAGVGPWPLPTAIPPS